MDDPERELMPPDGDRWFAPVVQLSRRPGRVSVDSWLALPDRLARGSRLVIVLHGVRRNAREYVETWREWSQQTGRPVLAPHFDQDMWPGARAYNLGNVLDSDGHRDRRRSWAFTALRHVVSDTRRQLRLTDLTWDLFGHSAGAQFAHRFALLRPSSTLRSIAVAGAGWFTVPDPSLDWPYGSRCRTLRSTGRTVPGTRTWPSTRQR